MEDTNFFQRRWRDVAMLIALICLWYFTGISIWFSVLFLAFFWATGLMAGKPSSYAFLSKVMRVVFVLGMLNVAVITFLPRFQSTRPTTLAFVDQTLSSLAPEDVKVRAKDIFTVKQGRASETFLRYYEFLLEEDRTKEAADTLAGFQKRWKFKPDTGEQDRRFGRGGLSGNDLSKPKMPSAIPMAQKDSVFRTGVYEIEMVNGVTPFNIILWFDGGEGNYTLESQNFETYVQFPNEVPIKAIPGANFGHRVGPRFRLFGNDQKVKLVVT